MFRPDNFGQAKRQGKTAGGSGGIKKPLTRFEVNRINELNGFISQCKTRIDLLGVLYVNCNEEESKENELAQCKVRGLIANAQNQIDYIRGKS